MANTEDISRPLFSLNSISMLEFGPHVKTKQTSRLRTVRLARSSVISHTSAWSEATSDGCLGIKTVFRTGVASCGGWLEVLMALLGPDECEDIVPCWGFDCEHYACLVFLSLLRSDIQNYERIGSLIARLQWIERLKRR